MKQLGQRAQLSIRARRANGRRQRAPEAMQLAERLREVSIATGSLRRLV